MHLGYARCSTKEQHEDRQIIALTSAGVEDQNIYVDKESGKDFNRTAYKRLLRNIKPGDVLFVKSIDRFGRTYDEIQKEWARITKEKQCDIVILDMPLLDTRSSGEFDLTGKLISDIVLQVMAFAANFERDRILSRQAEGIAAAKARGVKFGRAPLKRPKNYAQVKKQYERGDLSATMAGYRLGVSRATFAKWVKEDRTER